MINKMVDGNKSWLGLLNGLTKRVYYGESELTDEFLKGELYHELPDQEFQQILSRCQGLLKSVVSVDMDFNQLEAFLTSQMRKKDGGLTEEQAKVFTKFWKHHKQCIHEALIAECSWNNSLKTMSWRIDIATQARHTEQMNVPTAIVEMELENKHKQTSEMLQFEMNEATLNKVLRSVDEIEAEITKYSQQATTS